MITGSKLRKQTVMDRSLYAVSRHHLRINRLNGRSVGGRR